ncbi:hypothetical protein V7128_02275 [Neobacillus vireti]|uniref:hypothetical protein n=1 Tax=Neobacillus vireti TaxID=220686 RepID=UPI0030007F8F
MAEPTLYLIEGIEPIQKGSMRTVPLLTGSNYQLSLPNEETLGNKKQQVLQ